MDHGVYIGTSTESYIDVRRHEEMRAGIVPPVVSMYAVNPSHFDPEMAPKAKEINALQKRVDGQFEEMFPKEAKYIEDREGYVGPAHVSALSHDSVLPGLGGEAFGLSVSVGYRGKKKP